MLGHTKYPLAAVLLGLLVSSAQAITYNVIAEPPANMNVAVVVDKVAYPLEATLGILFKGEAPPATAGYHYAFTDNKDVKVYEPFMRPPLEKGISTTVNEFFNRSTTNYDLVTLPQVKGPLSSIKRIKSDLHIPYQIPSIHIYGNASATKFLMENQLEDNDVKLNVAYIGLDNVQVFEKVKISLAGRSSRWVDKLSYGLKLNKKNDTTLFGYKNFKLRALAHDRSYLRENLCYNVYKSSGIPASQFSYVRLFIDNKAVGLYGIIETFQTPWLASEFAGGKKDYKEGYLYQGIGFAFDDTKSIHISDLRYEGTSMAKYRFGQYKIKAGEHKKWINSYQKLQEFTQFINESSVSTTPESEWEKKLDVDGFIRAMALEDLLGLSDGYMTMANNYYIYNDLKQRGRMTYFPADMDSTLGNGIYNLKIMMSGNYSEHPGVFYRPLTSKVLSYPNYLKKYKQYILELTEKLVNPTVLFPYIDSVVNMIRQDVEWDLGLPRLGDSDIQPFGGENLEDVLKQIMEFSPAGLALGMNDTILSFDESISSSYRGEVTTSVKQYITDKSSNVLAFYKSDSM